jgi:hypothetical protein
MKLATVSEEQHCWNGQRRQIKALRSVPNLPGNPESERAPAKQPVLFQKVRPKSRF